MCLPMPPSWLEVLEHNNFLMKKTNTCDVLQAEIRDIKGTHRKISTFHMVGIFL